MRLIPISIENVNIWNVTKLGQFWCQICTILTWRCHILIDMHGSPLSLKTTGVNGNHFLFSKFVHLFKAIKNSYMYKIAQNYLQCLLMMILVMNAMSDLYKTGNNWKYWICAYSLCCQHIGSWVWYIHSLYQIWPLTFQSRSINHLVNVMIEKNA